MSHPAAIEFKAGKATLVDKTVTSDSQKGLLKFCYSPDDSLIHVTWRLRDAAEADQDNDFVFVPGDLKWVKVNACKTGRMYYLEFSSSNQKEFFWLQEPDPSKDSKIEKAIKAIEDFTPMDDEDDQMPIDSTPAPVVAPVATPSAPVKQESGNSYVSTPTQSVNKSSPANTTQTPSTQQINMDLFKDIFSKLPAQPKQPQVTLGKILTAENLIPFLKENPDIKNELLQHLPEEYSKDPSKINEVLYSPQFLQSLETLDYAIFEGHGAEIISLLGYEPTIASQRGVEGFLTNIQEESKKKQSKR